MTADQQSSAEKPPILHGARLSKVFGRSKAGWRKGRVDSGNEVRAVDNVTFTLQEGETIGIVGESGSGKSTLARLLLGLETLTSGVVEYRGDPVIGPDQTMPRQLRREIQFVAQDPYSNLDPRMKVGRIIAEGWRTHKMVPSRSARRTEALSLLGQVGITGDDLLERYPHEFSGGQRQRIAIARALALKPSVLILDEPISSLDVSVQAQVLQLLQDLQVDHGLSYVFIAHDLSVVEYFAHSVAVMYRGRIVEKGPSKDLFAHPRHPYTEALQRSNPQWQPAGNAIIEQPLGAGQNSTAEETDEACVFYHRCAYRTDRCAIDDPHQHWQLEAAHRYACYHPRNLEQR